MSLCSAKAKPVGRPQERVAAVRTTSEGSCHPLQNICSSVFILANLRITFFRLLNRVRRLTPINADLKDTTLGCELGVGVKLEKAAFLTPKGPDGYYLADWCFRRPPKGFLGMSLKPACNKNGPVGIIRDESLDHGT